MNQHYVPEFYLKNWADDKTKKFFYYKWVNGKVVEDDISPRSTGFEPDLYTRKTVPPDEENRIETEIYQHIDNKAAIICRKIIGKRIQELSHSEKEDWGQFLYSLLTRHPKIINNAKKLGSELVERKSKILSPEQQEKYGDQIKYYTNNIGIDTAAMMVTKDNSYNIANLDRFIEVLLKTVWWIEDYSNCSFTLLTSDWPVLFRPLNDTTNNTKNCAESLLNGCILGFPLSPSIIFHAHINGKLNLNTNRILKSQNLEIIKSDTKRYVYACNDSQSEFIKKHFKTKFNS